MEDVRIELLRELEQYILTYRPGIRDIAFQDIDDLAFSEINDYVDTLEGHIDDLEEELKGGGVLSLIKQKRVELENAAIAKEALSRVR